MAAGRSEGRAEGLIKGLKPALQLRFGNEGLAFLDEMKDKPDAVRLEKISDAVLTAATVDELRGL